MANPNQDTAHTVEDAAAKILEMATPDQEEVIEESAEATPEETTEEVVEETEESEGEGEETLEATEEPDDTFIAELNDWFPESKNQYDQIVVPTKINGVEGSATLADLIKTYQIGENVEQRSDSLKTERENFKSEKEAKLAEVNQYLNSARQLATEAEQSFLNEFNKVDWNELRESDPAEYAARRQDFTAKVNELQSKKSTIDATQREVFSRELQAKISEEASRLPELIPEWSDSKIAETEKTELRSYLLSQGLSARDIDGAVDSSGNVISLGITDSRAISLARKAMLFDRGQKKVEVTKKRVRKVPKITRPGKPKDKAEFNAEKHTQQRKKLKKSGSVDDAAELIRNRMFGG